ncbi:aldo/keto reductase [Salinirubellus salinus]|uniref:Aldo/keto reductase n=1 Tax=Salinirubellus salinus TaxID=1364945 RepID=A0A9E7UA29_9EURY|nr:aldo/keto reductase [Salinirubellus salinus]UWM53434.1 aldo/keto reductase [Salinirubellus salinus]
MDCALVGAGSVAERYVTGVGESSLRVVAVCDLDRDRAETLATRVGDATVYTDLETMLGTESVPLVVNLTSHGAHAGVTRACLRADRHVFSEKPLALEAETAAELVRTAADRGLALGCAPENHLADAQRHAHTLATDGRLGTVRFASATANVGRVDEWHDRPESFLAVGPLFDGAVYPLSLLVAWFGRVDRVRRADALEVWSGDRPEAAAAPPHVEATLEFVDGPVVALRASFYVDHRSREFYGLELHGDDGTLYLEDTGALAADRDAVTVRGGEREPTVAPHPQSRRARPHAAGPARLARSVERGRPSRAGARRAAHVVAVCEAIGAAATGDGGPVPVEDGLGGDLGRRASNGPPPVRPPATAASHEGGSTIRLPPIGFGCSRYRGDGEYVEPALGAALDTGYRLFDTAELYGNEWRLGDLLAGAGAPDRESTFLLGKPWRTNHGPGHLRQACEGSLDELGVDAFDCYALHWPDAWAHRGELRELSTLPVTEQEQLTFPTDETGDPVRADHSLRETWSRLEALYDDDLTRTLGVCNVTCPQLARLVEEARVPPALVQVERHPYRPRTDLVEWCHARGIRVVAHSPLSAPGLLTDPVVESVADTAGVTPAQAVLAWNVARGVVPIPSTTSVDHAVSNLAAARCRLDDRAVNRLDDLETPGVER